MTYKIISRTCLSALEKAVDKFLCENVGYKVQGTPFSSTGGALWCQVVISTNRFRYERDIDIEIDFDSLINEDNLVAQYFPNRQFLTEMHTPELIKCSQASSGQVQIMARRLAETYDELQKALKEIKELKHDLKRQMTLNNDLINENFSVDMYDAMKELAETLPEALNYEYPLDYAPFAKAYRTLMPE